MSEPKFKSGTKRDIFSMQSEDLIGYVALLSTYSFRLAPELVGSFKLAKSGSPTANARFIDVGETIIRNFEETKKIYKILTEKGNREFVVRRAFRSELATEAFQNAIKSYSDECWQYAAQYGLEDRLINLRRRIEKLTR